MLSVLRTSQINQLPWMQVYCPLCEDCYCPRSKYHDNIDGAFFGTTFPHLLLMTYPQLQPEAPADPYVPRVFGFKLSNAAPGRSQSAPLGSDRRQVSSCASCPCMQPRILSEASILGYCNELYSLVPRPLIKVGKRAPTNGSQM